MNPDHRKKRIGFSIAHASELTGFTLSERLNFFELFWCKLHVKHLPCGKTFSGVLLKVLVETRNGSKEPETTDTKVAIDQIFGARKNAVREPAVIMPGFGNLSCIATLNKSTTWDMFRPAN